MIIGIGNDLTDIKRIERVLQRHGARFINRCFTDAEQTLAENRRKTGGHITTYAKRFAAKEAAAKALGTGIRRGIYLRDIGVEHDHDGKPILKLTGGALKHLKHMTPGGTQAVTHLTISDTSSLAQAFVIIEAQRHKGSGQAS